MVYQTTLEENVRLPTNSIGDGYVFRLKSDSDSRADSIQIPTLEDNVKLPTTAPGAGYVFRRKKNLVGKERRNPLTVSNTSGCSRVLSSWQSSPYPKSSPSANLTIEIRGYIKTADSKLLTPTLEIRGYIKTADSKLLTPTLQIRGYIKTADSKLLTPTLTPTLEIRGYIKTADSKLLTPTLAFSL